MEKGREGGVGVGMGGSGRKKEIGGVCKNFEKIFLFFLHIRFFFFFLFSPFFFQIPRLRGFFFVLFILFLCTEPCVAI